MFLDYYMLLNSFCIVVFFCMTNTKFYGTGMMQIKSCRSIKLSKFEDEHEHQIMASCVREDVPPPHSARTLLISRPN